uniref:Uncharacterized protein n=1 Tax=Rhizophora mucronata TaxID=61149 RepID=A0A2P2KKN8_RHIMU
MLRYGGISCNALLNSCSMPRFEVTTSQYFRMLIYHSFTPILCASCFFIPSIP